MLKLVKPVSCYDRMGFRNSAKTFISTEKFLAEFQYIDF